jgi:hypothetical protein
MYLPLLALCVQTVQPERTAQVEVKQVLVVESSVARLASTLLLVRRQAQ